MDNRAGKFIKQPSGYESFIPNDLPPVPSVEIDEEMQELLSNADRKLGRLDGVTQTLPDTDIFVSMYVQKEAVLSSQIEGTQASLIDIFEMDNTKEDDTVDVVHYVEAMNYGLERMKTLPLSLRLIKEIHGKLLSEGRGSALNPGEFRRSQNWIGAAGSTLQNASFVPPDVETMKKSLYNFESFMVNDEIVMPSLIRIALLHAQFETIHPFLDGNGRVGRLLITFWLCQQEILSYPLLYLSYYFKVNRLEYYDRLSAVRRKGDWEGWIKFFLKGIAEVSDVAIESAKEILQFRKETEEVLRVYNNVNYLRLFDYLLCNPVVSRKQVAQALEISQPTANTIVKNMVEDNILKDISETKNSNKRYSLDTYVQILNKGTEVL